MPQAAMGEKRELKRSQERQQGGPFRLGETFKPAACDLRLLIMSADGLCGRAGRSIVEQRPPEAQAPKCRSPNFVGLRISLLDAITGPHVVKEKIGEERQ